MCPYWTGEGCVSGVQPCDAARSADELAASGNQWDDDFATDDDARS
jgi:hypothetical protein